MVEELKLAIKVDDDAIEQSLLKQFANAEKMANKVVLTFNNIDLDDKAIEAKFKEMQKMAGKNPIDLSIDKSSIEMLSAISEQLGNIFNIAKGKSIIDSSAIDNDAIKTTISLFEKIESSITAIRKVFADVGDGEEFSPLLKMINNVQSSISELATSVKGIGLNMNIDVRSDDELDRRLQTKVANALQAYQKLFDNIKMTSAGGSLINQEFFDFNLDNYDTAYQKLQAIVNFIKKQRVEAKKQFNGYDALYEDSDKSLWKSAQAYLAQVTKAETEIKKANSGESNPLENLFGNTKDLSEVIEQLNKVVEKLNEISSSATEFKNIFKEGFNVTSSVEEIDKLTNRVKELEDELSKIKLNPVSVDKSNISSENSVHITTIKEQEQRTSDIVKLVDNYGRELDEVNSKLLEGTALLDKQGKLIRLYHGSDTEFDKFDLSLSNNESNQIYGKGAYLIGNEKGAGNYGNVVTQWYANVRAIMDEEQKLTLEEAKKLYDEFGSKFLSIATGKPMDFDEFFESYLDFNPEETTVIEKMKDLAGFLGKDVGEVMETIGYDAFRMQRGNGTFYTIFDPDRIIRFKEETVKATNVIEEFNQVQNKSSKNTSTPSMKDVFQGGTTSAEKLEGEIKNIDSATEKASESAKEYRKILSQVGEFDIDSKVSAMYKRNDGQLESWTWRAKKDDKGNVLYDQNGKIDYDEPTITVISKYEQLEKIIVKADNELRNLQKDLAEIKAYDPTASTTNIEAKISDQKEYVQLLEQTVKVISQSDEYLLDEQQIIEARNKAAREYALTTGAKQEKTDAKQSASDEKKRLANIEQVNRALNKQQITIDAIEKTYNKTTNLDLDREVSNQQDLAELTQKKLAIQTKINSLQGQERNSANEKEFLELEKLIAEYKELAKYKLKANNPSKQELGGQNLQTLIQVQISNYDKLITKAEKYGYATSDTVEKLKEQRDILSKIGSDGKYSATVDQYYASRDTYKVESAALSAFEAETRAIEQKTQAVKKLSDELEVYNKQVPKKPIDGQRSDKFEGLVQNYKNAINEAQKYLDNLGDSPVTEEVKKEWKKLIEVIKEAKKEMDSIPTVERGSDALSRGKEIDTITKYLNKFTGISKQAKRELNGLLKQLQSGDPSVNVKKIHERFLELTVAERNAGREARNLFDIFKDKKIYSFLGQAASMFSFYDLINLGRQGFTVIKDLDSALTEMRKVSDETVSSLKKFQTASFDVSQQVGATALEIQNSAADFMRLGYSLKDASKFAEDANIYANVGDMDISEATEHMISSIQAWQSEFSNATEASTNIIDRYNEVGNRFAITSADIGSAMERSAAALKAGGNTLNESIGLITAGNLIQQDADTTANALKVMSLRIRGAKADLESMGESTDDLANSTSKLRDQIKSLTGVDIMIDKNTFKSTTRIIQEIGAEWEKLTDVSKASTLELLAGKTRASTVAGLLENYQTIGEVIKVAEESSGSARKENERYLESINGKIALLTNNLQKLAYDVIESELLKSIVDFGSGTIKILDSVVTVFDKINSSITSLGGLLGESNGLAGTFGIISGLLMNKAGIGECTTF